MFDCFEKVHAEYVQAFAGYRKRILEGREPLSTIAASIESDNLLTAGQRIKTLEFAKYSESADSERLIEAMRLYLLDPAVSIMVSADGPYAVTSQVFRRSLIHELRLIEDGNFGGFSDPASVLEEFENVFTGKENKRTLAVKRLDQIATRMQKAYANAVDAYSALRRKLLSPA